MLSKATWRYPSLQEVPLNDFSSLSSSSSSSPPPLSLSSSEPFLPSRVLKKEQKELQRLKKKHEVYLARGIEGKGLNDVQKEKEWLEERVEKRYEEEYERHKNPPPTRISLLLKKFAGDWPWYFSIIGCIFIITLSLYVKKYNY